MARDVAGDYTLPVGNPVVAGTTITTTWANTTMNDIAVALTDSLDRNGRGGMLAALGFTDGTESAPGAMFEAEPTSGFYRAAAGDIRLSILTNDLVQLTADGLTLTGFLDLDDDPDTGDGVGNRDYNDARYLQLTDTGIFAVAAGRIDSDGAGAQSVTETFGISACSILASSFRFTLSAAVADIATTFIVGSVIRDGSVSEIFNWNMVNTTTFDVTIVTSADTAVTDSTVGFSFMVYELP